MVGFPVLGGGKPVTLGGATGIIYQQSPEEEAFNRWQHGEFLEVERGNAKRWRRELESIDLKAMAASFKGIRSIITAFWFLKFQEIDVSTDQAACEISQRRVILAGAFIRLLKRESCEVQDVVENL